MTPLYSQPLFLSHRINLFRIRTRYCSAKVPDINPPKEDLGASVMQRWGEIGKTMARNSMQRVSISAKNWWNRYEEFVGIVEVREAQGKVAEAEKDFMVARGIVREARDSLEAQQLKLKEVRDRLDRVSREDVQYLELATMEHKLLQEEKRLRASYVFSEESEREKFSLFSASVRESHEKERTRAERTKNWSVIGSVLGAVIGVMGSTYINRVRLQELKSLLLEAQKGPISLQAAIHEHASVHQSQQKDLRDLIAAFTNMLPSSSDQDTEKGLVALPVYTRPAEGVDPVLVAVKENLAQTKKTEKFLESLEQQYGNLDKTVCKIATDVQNVKARVFSQLSERTINSFTQVGEGHTGQLQSVVQELTEAEQRLGIHINRNSIYSTALTCTVFAVTLPILYILLKGN